MSDGEVRYVRDGQVATVIFDRPAARNAMTWRMYEQLGEACARIGRDDAVRVAVFRGAGGKPFIAGTDIAQFQAFRGAEDGIAYEAKMEGYLAGLEALPVPTLAVIEGYAIGGGLAIAAACDLRIATPGSRFGVPIARTLGNCLSMANYARLVAALGASRAKRVLLLAENLSAEEALAGGFLSEIIEPADLDRRVAELTDRLAHHAPITMRVSKEAIRRLVLAGLPDGDDLVRACYGSEDFKTGVRAFVDKREPQWTGK
jgi:enoyl-CoA hydratase